MPPILRKFGLGPSMVRMLGLEGELPGFVLNEIAKRLSGTFFIDVSAPDQPFPCPGPEGNDIEVDPGYLELWREITHAGPTVATSTTLRPTCQQLGPLDDPGLVSAELNFEAEVLGFGIKFDAKWQVTFLVKDPIWTTARCGAECLEEEYVGRMRAQYEFQGTIEITLPDAAEWEQYDPGQVHPSGLNPTVMTRGGHRIVSMGAATTWHINDTLEFLVSADAITPIPPEAQPDGQGGFSLTAYSAPPEPNGMPTSDPTDCIVNALLNGITPHARTTLYGARFSVVCHFTFRGPRGDLAVSAPAFQLSADARGRITPPPNLPLQLLTGETIRDACRPGFVVQVNADITILAPDGSPAPGLPVLRGDSAPCHMWCEKGTGDNNRILVMFQQRPMLRLSLSLLIEPSCE